MARRSGAGGVILVAVVLGLVTAYLVWAQFRKAEQKEQRFPVVVAKQDIKARTKITRDMLELSAFPKDLIAQGTVTQIPEAEGKMAVRDLRAKEQLRAADLVQEGMLPTLAYKVPEGMRAIAIGAGEVMAVGTSVQPGDRVDILVTYNDPQTKQDLTRILMQNVLVLAVNRGQTEPGDKGGGANSSMTLAVKPEDTELVAAADRQGALRVSLRPVNDNSVVATEGITAHNFRSGFVVEQPTNVVTQPARIQPVIVQPPPVPAKPPVTIIRGTQEQVVNP